MLQRRFVDLQVDRQGNAGLQQDAVEEAEERREKVSRGALEG